MESGLVVRSQSRVFTVRTASGETPVRVPKRLSREHRDLVDPLAVGDRVTFTPENDRGVLEGIEPRRNVLSRPAVGRSGQRQLLAANLDRVVVVVAARTPRWKPAIVDRYLVLASAAGIAPLVCLNKSDLGPPEEDEAALAVYARLEVPVLRVSAATGQGMEDLVRALTGLASVLVGPSGTGKSTLANRLVPEAAVRVGEVSDQTGRGRHTTTWVELLDLPSGGHLIDSPGLRVLGLSGVPPEDLALHFPEIREHAGGCRFQDCRHRAEPGCAVKAAVAGGAVAEERYASYTRIYASLESGSG